MRKNGSCFDCADFELISKYGLRVRGIFYCAPEPSPTMVTIAELEEDGPCSRFAYVSPLKRAIRRIREEKQ